MVTLIAVGRVANIETRTLQSGASVTRFSVGVSTSRKEADGTYHTEWTDFDAWSKTGEYVAQYIGKGDLVEVHAEKYTTKKDGKSYTNYTARNVTRLLKAKPAEGAAAPAAGGPATADISEEEIPF